MGAWSEEAKARVRPRERALAIGLGHHPRCNRSFPKRHAPPFIAEVRALWEKGFSPSAIGKRLGVTTNDIGEIMLRNDFPAARFPHLPECAMTSATPTAPRSRSEWHYNRLTAEERAQLEKTAIRRTEQRKQRETRNTEARKLRSAGMTFEAIGRKLGISAQQARIVGVDAAAVRSRVRRVANVAEALRVGGTRASAMTLLARSFPIPADALMSIIRDDRALGISIVRRSAGAV